MKEIVGQNVKFVESYHFVNQTEVIEVDVMSLLLSLIKLHILNHV